MWVRKNWPRGGVSASSRRKWYELLKGDGGFLNQFMLYNDAPTIPNYANNITY
jgi:hypothetical protein